jgi:hypothetical protein
MSTISDVRRRFARAANIDFSNIKLLSNNKGQTTRSLASSIDSVEDPSARKRLKELHRDAAASGGTFTQLERDMINRLIKAVKDGGNLDLALAAEVIDVVSDLSKTSARGELYENQRDIAFLLLDAIGSNKYDKKDLKPIIDEFRKLSTDDDGFTEKDAQRIRNLLMQLMAREGDDDRRVADESLPRISLPGGSGRGGGRTNRIVGGFDGFDPVGKDPVGKDPKGKDTQGEDSKGSDADGSDAKGKDTDGSDSNGKGAADGKGKGRGGGADGKGKDDDRGDDTTKPDLPTLVGVGAAIDTIAGAGDEAKDKDKRGADDKDKDDKRGPDDKDKDDKRGADDKGKDDKGKDDARGTDDKSRDPKGKDPEGKDDKGKGEDGRVEADGPPTDIKLPRKVIDGKFPDGTRVQDPENPKDPPVRSNPDDVDGGNEATTKDPEKSQTEEPTSKGTDEVGKDGRPLTGRVSGTLSFVLLRTPDPKWMRDGKVEDIVGRVFSLGRSSGDKASVLQFRFVKGDIKNGKQLYDLQQRVPGKGEGSWEVISKGWSGDAQAQWGKTYEWTAGAAANVGAGNSGDVLDGSGVTGYTQGKLLDTFRVQDQSWDKERPNSLRDAKRQFRVRLITQAQIGTGWGKDGDGGNSVGPLGFDPLKVEYRWGYTTNTPEVPGTKLPSASTQYEWGFSVGIGTGLDLVKIGAAADDPRKFLDILAASPSLTATVQFWVTGLKRLERWTIAKESRLARGPQNWKKDVLKAVLLGIGKTFQSWVFSGNISLTGRGNNADAPKDDELGVRFVPQSSTGTSGSQATTSAGNGGLPTHEELESMAEKSMAQFDKLMDWLDKSGLADLAKTAAPIIELASLANDVRKLASKKGFAKFAIEQLTPEQRERLDVLIMSRAFDLAMSASVEPGKDGKPDARKSFTMLGGESVAEYGARILKLVGGKLGEAAKDVLLDEASWDDFLFASTSSSGSGSGSSGGGGPIAGGDPTAGGKAAAIGAAIGAGLGLGGLIAGLGKDDDNKDDKDDKDVDKPTAPGGAGGSRNAALKAVHEADEEQGDRLPITVEGEASIYITPKLAADPVYMAAYVARLAHDQDDIAAARKYAAAMSDLGYSRDAARVLAPLLTNAEIADPAFMKMLSAALAGIKRQPSDIGGVIYESQVKAALEALRGKQPADPSAEPTDPSVEPTDKDPASSESPRELADRVIRLGSENGVWVNRSELEKGLEAAGLEVQASDEAWERVISTYGAAGTGVLTAAELADAIEDGVVRITQDGAVTVNARALQEQQRPNSQNVALRVITSLDIDALTTVAQLREGFRNAGYELTATDAQLEEFLRLYNHGRGIDHSSLTGAIAVAVLKIVGADGRVTVDQAVLDLLKPPPRLPGGIEDPLVGQPGPGSIVIDGEPA